MLWAGKVLQLFGVYNRTAPSRAEYIFSLYMERLPELHEVDREQDCYCLRWGFKNVCEYSSATGGKPKSRMESNMGEWVELKPFRGIYRALHIGISSHGFLPQSRALLWPYHYCYINKHFGDDLLK